MTIQADLVLKNGRIFVGLGQPYVESIAIFGNRVLALGNGTQLDGLVGADTKVMELNGRAVIPGINDGHQHLLSVGMAMGEVDLRPEKVSTLAEALEAIKQQVDKTKSGEWVFGGRYDHFNLDVGRHPFREELDQVSPENPVYIKRTCGHMGVANSLALKAAGVDMNTPNPAGGNIERQNGQLTGLLQERAQSLVLDIMPPLPLETLIQGVELAGDLFWRQGITSVMDAAVGMRQGFDHYLAYQEARRQRRLPVRMYLAFSGGPGGVQETAWEHGLITGAGDEFLKAGTVKLFTDGSAGGKTAAMREPYRCSCNEMGMLLFLNEDLRDYVTQYHSQGYQISIHAIGDAAIDQAIDAIAAADEISPSKGRRHRIEHCGFTTADQIDRMSALGILPAPQPVFIYEFGDLYIDVLGEQRPRYSYPMKTWMERGLYPIASTDAPVCDSNPMKNLYSMLTRMTDRGTVIGEEETLSIEQALSAMTYNGAYGSFSETEKGTLETGKLADLVVLERDIFAASADEILHTVVDVTVIDGDVVFDRNAEVRGT